MDIAYDYEKIVYVYFETVKKLSIAKGYRDKWAQTYSVMFPPKTPFIGFVGYEKRYPRRVRKRMVKKLAGKKEPMMLAGVTAFKNFCESDAKVTIVLETLVKDKADVQISLTKHKTKVKVKTETILKKTITHKNLSAVIAIWLCTVVLLAPLIFLIIVLSKKQQKAKKMLQ